MSEYIFQGETMTGLADSFRYKLKNTDNLSVEEMRKLVYLMHYDLDNGVTLYDYNNNPVYSYSIAEANNLSELPSDVYSPSGYVFKNWSHTIEEINGTTTPLIVTAVYDELVSEFKFVTPSENTSVSLKISNYSTGDIVVDWGDGNVDNPSIANAATAEVTHTYSAAGEYTAKVRSDYYVRLSGPGSTLTDVNLGRNVNQIPNNAFYGCSSLTSIVIPDGVTSIGWNAFQGCSSLTNITIPNSVTSIGFDAFRDCTGLTSVEIFGDVYNRGGLSGLSNLTSLTVYRMDDPTRSAANVNYTCFGVLFGNKSYSNMTSCRQTVGSNSSDFYLPNDLTTVTVLGGKLYTGAFRGCTTIKNIILGDDIILGESEPVYVFTDCTSLETVELGKSITRTSDNCRWFADGLPSLKQVTLPNTITYLGGRTFYQYTGEIIFKGTQAEWNAISKHSAWNYQGSATVTCIG